MSEKGSAYYDAIYNQIIAERGESGEWIDERHAVIIPHIIGSVLDIGCGLGEIADKIGNAQYVGLDISSVAIEYAKAKCTNPNATFFCLGYEAFRNINMRFDTVLLLEILEHLAQVGPVADIAMRLATKRIIVTVPRDMPGRAHVRPTWMKSDLQVLLGPGLGYYRLFGGPDNDRWWLAIKDV